jgi:uncharacterized protein YgiM (DUF1202 family)
MRSYFANHLPRERRSLLAALVIAGVTSAAAIASDDFAPYRARIITPSASIRSGPGESFYATDTLAEGAAVEVYRQQANGWCAIRPPEGSFSWVFGRHVGTVEQVEMSIGDGSTRSSKLAQIDKPDVASRIGSRLVSLRNAVQVRLKKGEVVRILGEETEGGETWYRIAPPSGEFRWIHVSQIRRVGPIPAESNETSASTNVDDAVSNAIASEPSNNEVANVAVATASSDDAPAASKPAPTPAASVPRSPFARPLATEPAPPLLISTDDSTAASALASPKSNDAWRAAPEPIATQPTTSPQASTVPGAAGVSPAVTPTTLPTATPSTTISTQITTPTTSVVGNVSPSLADLELRLSRMVVESPVAWNVESLESEARAMLAATQAPADRAAIQTTLAKMERFKAVAARYRQAVGVPGPPPATLVGPDGSRYDAVGVLRPVASRRPGAPPFALVDERGVVLSFVTPTAGVNLQPYVGQRIGVTGNRGFIPEFQRAHVVAGRVGPVADRMLR